MYASSPNSQKTSGILRRNNKPGKVALVRPFLALEIPVHHPRQLNANHSRRQTKHQGPTSQLADGSLLTLLDLIYGFFATHATFIYRRYTAKRRIVAVAFNAYTYQITRSCLFLGNFLSRLRIISPFPAFRAHCGASYRSHEDHEGAQYE